MDLKAAVFESAKRKAKALPWIPLGVFFLALLVRVVYIYEISKSPFILYPGIDANHYQNWALGLVNGTWPNNRSFVWPPLYPVFLGLSYYLVGNETIAVKIVQAVLGSLSCVLTFLVARRLFDSRFVSVAASVACCLSGPLIFFDAELLSANLDTFLQLAALLSLMVAADRESIRWWALAGVCVGLSAINRGGALILLPLVLMWIRVLPRWRSDSGSGAPTRLDAPRFWKSAAAFLVPVGILILPVAWHNAKYVFPEGMPPGSIYTVEDSEPSVAQAAGRLASGRFALLSSEVGLNLYLGNHWGMRELNDPNHPDCFDTYKRIRNDPFKKGVRTAHERNRYFVGKTAREISARPGQWMRLIGAKLFDLVNGAEKPRNMSIYANRKYSGVLSALLWKKIVAFPSGLIIPFGLLGFWLALARWRRHFMPIVFFATHGLFVLTFFVASRYRLASYPLLAIYGAYAASRIYGHFTRRRWAEAAYLGTALAALLVLSNLNIGAMQRDHGVFEYNNLGLTLALRKRYDEALATLSKALEMNPKDTATHNNIALVLDEMGRREEAVEHLRASLREIPDSVETLNNLGNALVQLGMYEEGALRFRQALSLEPNYVYALSNYGNLLMKLNRVDEAIDLYRKALSIDNDFAPAHKNLADAFYRRGEISEANRHYFEASRLMGGRTP